MPCDEYSGFWVVDTAPTFFLSRGLERWLRTWSQRQSAQLRRAGALGEGVGDDQYGSPLEHLPSMPLMHCLMMRFGGSYTEYQSNRISTGVN